MIDSREITVIAATELEAAAVRRECPNLRVVESGIGLAKIDRGAVGDTLVSCGIAGGLSPELPTGTVLVPREIERPNGERIACDESLQRALAQSSRRLGFEPVEAPMITSATIVHGEDRARLAARGFAGVDMESGLFTVARIAVVRVILDTPRRELSSAWLHPAVALLNPLLWPQAMWLARNAAPSARTAARVLRAAIEA